MMDLKTLTRVISVYCILIILYLLIPDSYLALSKVGKYFLIIVSIVILMIYYKTLGQLSSNNDQNSNSNYPYNEKIEPSGQYPKDSYEELTTLIIDTTKLVSTNSRSAIYVINPKNNSYALQAGKLSEFADAIPAKNSIINKHIINNRKLNQKDHPDLWNELFIGHDWRGSECAVFSIINIRGAVAGFILTRMNHFNDATDRECKMLSQLGQIISSSLENLDMLEKHMIGEDTKLLILEILSDLDFKSDVHNIFNQFRYLIRSFFKYDRATVSIRKESENRRKSDKGVKSSIKLTDGDKDEFVEGADFPTNGSLHGLPVINGTGFQTTNWKETYQNLARFSVSESDDYKYNSVIGAPLIIEGESRGSIILEKIDQGPFSNLELTNLVLIGKVLGSALNWRYEYKKIHNNATHDGLSGLLNHQTFKERFNDEIQRAERFQQKMAVMMFDLDKFKQVNDTLGHQYGDYVIQTVAKIMEDNVRSIDVVSRYGGEEFAVILINTTAEMSNIVAQRIVDNIADYNFTMDGVEKSLTISGGMSEYPTHSKTMTGLIEIADKEMYATKERGGNGITIHDRIES